MVGSSGRGSGRYCVTVEIDIGDLDIGDPREGRLQCNAARTGGCTSSIIEDVSAVYIAGGS